MGTLNMDRRGFLKLAALGATAASASVALGGCSAWTPRSQAGADRTDEDGSAQGGSSMADLDDGMILIGGGAFLMGSPESENWRGGDEVLHEVTVSSFYLSPLEVTQAQYADIMGDNPSSNVQGSAAVEGLTWVEAIAYCNALSARHGLEPVYMIEGERVTWDRSADGYRLPTEAEWEYACRADTTTPFNTETSISADSEANYYGTYPYEIEDNYFSQRNLQTKPGTYRQREIEPGSFPANAWGLFDMHGNVGEWVWDAYGPYDLGSSSDPTGPDDGELRVYRGGGWNDFGKNLRSAYRAALPADAKSASVGMRLARNAEASEGAAHATIPAAAAKAADVAGRDALICFFSWSGNTRGIAQEIASQTGYDAVELELVHPYSSDYSTVLEQSQHDQNIQARPELSTVIDGMASYDTIILGYPNWWASIPMPIATFLESYDFSGKRIIPFCSHGGGRLGQSVSAISKLAPQATIGEALAVHYSGGSALGDDVARWLEANGIQGSQGR